MGEKSGSDITAGGGEFRRKFGSMVCSANPRGIELKSRGE